MLLNCCGGLKSRKNKKMFEFTSISSCVTPMSAARRDILSESGCLQDLKASSRAMDFSLSSPSLLRISAIVRYFALVLKNVENLEIQNSLPKAWILVFSGFRGQLGSSDLALELLMVWNRDVLVQIFRSRWIIGPTDWPRSH